MSESSLERQCDRRLKQNVYFYRSLISVPGSISLKLPSSVNLALASRSSSGSNRTGMTVVGPTDKTIHVPPLAAGIQYAIGWFERGSVVTLAASFDLYVGTGLGSFKKILIGP